MESPAGLRLVLGALGLLPALLPVAGLVQRQPLLPTSTVLVVVAGVAYGWCWLGPGRRELGPLLMAVTTLAVLGALAVPSASSGTLLLVTFPSVLLGFRLPARWALLAQGVLCAVAVTETAARGWRQFDIRTSLLTGTVLVLLIVLAGAAAVAVSALQRTNVELRVARARIEGLAVAAERERFARDLHDLVGHTLSLMLIKLQVASTTLADPARASAELVDLRHLARTALDDIREAVGGYRQPTLAAELSGARIALDAAGIRLAVDDNAGPLPAAAEAVLAWGVREAVTNVIRHSDAANCRIGITRAGRQVCLDVADDGRGCAHASAESGLRSLRERVTTAGGCLSAGNRPRGGFAIAVRMPVAPGEAA